MNKIIINLIKVGDWHIFKDIFEGNYLVTLEEVFEKIEDLYLENEYLKEEIRELGQEPEEDNEDYIEVCIFGEK